MKKFSFNSFLSVSILALAGIIFSNIGNKTLAAYAGDYSEFTPSGCPSMNVVYVGPSDFITPFSIQSDKIYVLTGGTYTITQNIDMQNCAVFITDGNATTPVVFDFQGGTSFVSNGQNNFTIRGFDDTHRLEILGSTSPYGIYTKNSIGITLSHLTLSGFSTYGVILENVDNSSLNRIEIKNIGSRGILLSDTASNNIISDTDISSTPDGIRLQSDANNNTISNTNIQTTSRGILLDAVIGNIINSNTIISGTMVGIYADAVSGTTISDATIKNNSLYGIYLGGGSNNTITENTFTTNTEGIFGDNTQNNIFSENQFTANTKGIRLDPGCSGNTFDGDEFLSNTAKNIELNDAHYNQFTNVHSQGSLIGIELTDANYNEFIGTTVVGNTEGIKLTSSSHNTLYLTHNNNGILLYGGSDNNSIYNKQSGNTGLNNITIYNGSNNVITGGIFSTASTTSTTVTANLKFDAVSPWEYAIAGAGMSGTYTGTVPTGTTTGVTVTITAGNGAKAIEVTYENGNIQYDSITKGSSGGGNGGGGGGGTPTCTSQQLVCISGVRTRGTGVSCQGGNLGNACTITTGNINSGTNLPVGSIAGSTFSNEMNQAYLRAYANGITTMPTIQQANMTGKLIRSHMAKMISAFAILLGDRLPNESLACNFNDIANQSIEMKFYIKLSCQLGLMGQNISNFNPREEVTRAQFGTIMSRLIRGSLHNGGTPYYTSHLNALKLAGIMTQISNPYMKEVRGYVMIMMKRTYEGGFLNN